MKVLLLARALEYGGTQRQIVMLAKGLKTSEIDVAVAVFYPGGVFEEDLTSAGVRVISLDKRGRWDIAGFLRRTLSVINEERPDVLYGFLDGPNVVVGLVKLMKPSLRVVMGVRASEAVWSRNDLLSKLTFRLCGLLSRFVDLISFNSVAGMRFHASRGYPIRKSTVIPNGVSGERFYPDKAAGEAWRREIGIRQDAVAIGIVGRLDPMKDHATFLEAAAIAARKDHRLVFLCIGGGPSSYRRKLETTVDTLDLRDKVIWIASVDDMNRVYNGLDIVTLTSLGEGFPNVVAEAMACGTPCVVTDVGDAESIVGDVGMVVPVKDPRAVASAWEQTIERLRDDHESMTRAARDHIFSRFSEQRLIERSIAELQGVVQ